MNSNRERYPEPSPNSLIDDILKKRSGHKVAKIDKTVIQEAREADLAPLKEGFFSTFDNRRKRPEDGD